MAPALAVISLVVNLNKKFLSSNIDLSLKPKYMLGNLVVLEKFKPPIELLLPIGELKSFDSVSEKSESVIKFLELKSSKLILYPLI